MKTKQADQSDKRLDKKHLSRVNSNLILGCILFIATGLQSQSLYWEGGTPGREKDWNCAENWQENRTPGIMDRVVIPNLHSKGEWYPEVKQQAEPIATLLMLSGAELTIDDDGVLTIDGATTYADGLINKGIIIVKGDLNIVNVALSQILNSGEIIWDEEIESSAVSSEVLTGVP